MGHWSQLCWVLLKFQNFNTRCVLETARTTYFPAEADLAENQLADNLHHNQLFPTVGANCSQKNDMQFPAITLTHEVYIHIHSHTAANIGTIKSSGYHLFCIAQLFCTFSGAFCFTKRPHKPVGSLLWPAGDPVSAGTIKCSAFMSRKAAHQHAYGKRRQLHAFKWDTGITEQ